MELFFDLVFVALIGQLAEGLRTHATFSELGIFLALFASVWWTWVNLTFTSNIQSGLSRRAMAGFVLAAMAGVGVLAVAAPEAVGELAWLFAVGNAAVRAVLLALWVRRSWTTGLGARIRLLTYNGGTAILWLVSAFLPAPVDYVLWAAAILIEIVLLVVTAPSMLERFRTINVDHLAERFGTLVIITLGECVLSIVTTLSEEPLPLPRGGCGNGPGDHSGTGVEPLHLRSRRDAVRAGEACGRQGFPRYRRDFRLSALPARGRHHGARRCSVGGHPRADAHLAACLGRLSRRRRGARLHSERDHLGPIRHGCSQRRAVGGARHHPAWRRHPGRARRAAIYAAAAMTLVLIIIVLLAEARSRTKARTKPAL
jgi:hypothetical protein